MRLTKEKTAENRAKIVKTAAKLFRERGMDGVGLNDVMSEAGFTHGGFYNHFESKEDLAAAAVMQAFAQSYAESGAAAERSDDAHAAFAKTVADYLSTTHRDRLEDACPTAAMPCDVARHGKEVQDAFADGLDVYLDTMTERLGGSKEDAKTAIATLATMVGAMILARSVRLARPKLSSEFLEAARDRIPEKIRVKKASKRR